MIYHMKVNLPIWYSYYVEGCVIWFLCDLIIVIIVYGYI